MKSLRVLLSFAIIVALAYVGWFFYSNNTADPRALADGDKHQTALDAAKPYAAKAADAAIAAKDWVEGVAAEAFSSGGLADEADAYLEAPATTPTPPAEVAAAPAQPEAPAKSATTIKLEGRIRDAEQVFAAARDDYRAADPARGGWTKARKGHVDEARVGFARVRDLLDGSLDSYQQQPDHDAGVLKKARSLQRLNQRLLYNANKMSDGLGP